MFVHVFFFSAWFGGVFCFEKICRSQFSQKNKAFNNVFLFFEISFFVFNIKIVQLQNIKKT